MTTYRKRAENVTYKRNCEVALVPLSIRTIHLVQKKTHIFRQNQICFELFDLKHAEVNFAEGFEASPRPRLNFQSSFRRDIIRNDENLQLIIFVHFRDQRNFGIEALLDLVMQRLPVL
jgi:hypothetical protein